MSVMVLEQLLIEIVSIVNISIMWHYWPLTDCSVLLVLFGAWDLQNVRDYLFQFNLLNL